MNRCPKCGTQFEGTGGSVACPLVDEVKRLRAWFRSYLLRAVQFRRRILKKTWALADALARAEDAEADFSRLKAEMQARTAAEAEAWEAEAWEAEKAARAAEAPGEASLQRRIAALEAVVSQFLAAHWVDVEADGQVVDHWNVRLLEEAAKAARRAG